MCNFVGMKKAIVIIFAVMFCLLAASYYFDSGRKATLRADTTEGYYMVPEADIRERIPCHFSRAAAEEILTDLLMCQADKWHLRADGVEVISYEEFPTIHNHYSFGSIISLKMQLKPGILSAVTGCGEVVF